jgi:protein SCO1/2
MMRTAGTLLLWSSLVANAQAAPQASPIAQQIDVRERVGAVVASELRFTTAQGASTTLGDLRARGLPILLVLSYARCPMLCSWVLQGVSQALPGLQAMKPGRDYLPVVVSIDPRETPADAAAKQATLLARLHLQGRPRDFPFLVGEEGQVRALAASLGFGYAWDARTEQYAHPAVVFVLTPQLRVSSYLYGVQYPAKDLQTALLDAREGRLAPRDALGAGAQALLRCFQFITGSQLYAKQLRGYFQLAGVVILAAVVTLLAVLVVRERRRRA